MTATNFTIPLGTQIISDGNSSLTIDGKAYSTSSTITRPANTTAYTAGDVTGDAGGSAIVTLSNAGPDGGYIIIQSLSLVFSNSSVPSGMGSFRVHFYTDTPTSIADNASFDLTVSDRSVYAGYADLSVPLDFGSTIYTQTDYPGRLIKLASTTLYAQIQTLNAYTPVSGSTVQLRVKTLEAGL